MDRVVRRGPLSASPWPAKKGDTFEIVNIFVAVARGPNEVAGGEKVTMPKGGPFGIFQNTFCCKTSKIDGGTLWGNKLSEKSRSAEKN